MAKQVWTKGKNSVTLDSTCRRYLAQKKIYEKQGYKPAGGEAAEAKPSKEMVAAQKALTDAKSKLDAAKTDAEKAKASEAVDKAQAALDALEAE